MDINNSLDRPLLASEAPQGPVGILKDVKSEDMDEIHEIFDLVTKKQEKKPVVNLNLKFTQHIMAVTVDNNLLYYN